MNGSGTKKSLESRLMACWLHQLSGFRRFKVTFDRPFARDTDKVRCLCPASRTIRSGPYRPLSPCDPGRRSDIREPHVPHPGLSVDIIVLYYNLNTADAAFKFRSYLPSLLRFFAQLLDIPVSGCKYHLGELSMWLSARMDLSSCSAGPYVM